MAPAKNVSLIALSLLSFALADVRDGLGPFLGVYLQEKGWMPDEIGYVMTVGGLAGMLFTTPLGALTDSTRYKRFAMAVATVLIVLSVMAVFLCQSFVLVAGMQVIQGIMAAAIAPLLTSISLGVVGQKGLVHRLGQNEAWNHFGNFSTAALGGLIGYFYGIPGVFAVMLAMGLFSVLFVMMVNPAVYTAATVILAQLTMVPMALWAAKIAEKRGYGMVILLALLALPVRGLVAGFWHSPWSILPVQILDGVGAGLIGVATPGIVARILRGTGHVNLGLGVVMTLQGIGAASSSTLGGLFAHHAGYSAAFLALTVAACCAVVLFLGARKWLPAFRRELVQ